MRSVPTLIAITLVWAAAACAEPTSAAAAPQTPATADAGSPEAFVRSLYRSYEDTPFGDTEPQIWSARTTALIAESDALTENGYVGYFEANPICACQDDGGMVLTSVDITQQGPDRADATVVMTWTMAEPVSTQRQTYNLVREADGWRIDDIQRDQTGEFPQPPLVEDITRWIAEERAAR